MELLRLSSHRSSDSDPGGEAQARGQGRLVALGESVVSHSDWSMCQRVGTRSRDLLVGRSHTSPLNHGKFSLPNSANGETLSIFC